MICFVTASVQGGKTSFAREVVAAARSAGLRVGGVLCPGEMTAGERVSISVTDLATGEVMRLADTRGPGSERAGRFHLFREGLEMGRRALRSALQARPPPVGSDEIGPLA